jgi:hypothetical protein
MTKKYNVPRAAKNCSTRALGSHTDHTPHSTRARREPRQVDSSGMNMSQSKLVMTMFFALAVSNQRIVVGAFRSTVVTRSVLSSRRKLSRPHVCQSVRLQSSSEPNDEASKRGTLDSQDGKFAEYRNKNNIRDQVFSAISGDGGIKVTVATVRNLINDMMMQHTLTEVPTEALGRTMVCGLLMANGIQDEQVVQITMNGTTNANARLCHDGPIHFTTQLNQLILLFFSFLFFTGDGPLRGVVAIASGIGEVKGYVGTPMLGNMPLADAVGKGSVQIVKNHPSWPRPYNGITAIRHGDIDRDIGT